MSLGWHVRAQTHHCPENYWNGSFGHCCSSLSSFGWVVMTQIDFRSHFASFGWSSISAELPYLWIEAGDYHQFSHPRLC